MKFYEEKLHAGIVNKGYAQKFDVEEVLFSDKTEFQELVVFKNPYFGNVMALDGVIQVTERDEFFYHEIMAHLPIMAHGNVSNVLIIGGGDGGVLREVLAHQDVAVTMVELDSTVVDISKKYFKSICADAFDNPRTNLMFADGIKYVAETTNKYDVIIVDSTDPIGVGEVLFTIDFYKNCRRCLTTGGILITQNGVPFFQPDEVSVTNNRMKSAGFKDNTFATVPVPTYVGGLMTLGWGCDDPQNRQKTCEQIGKKWNTLGITTKYYNPQIHVSSFSLPNYIADLL